MSVNLTESNKDYAVFLPSISTFYQNFISKDINQAGLQQPAERIPAGFDKGVKGCDWLNKEDSYYNYKWSLYSAGHAQLDTSKSDVEESMIQQRNREETFILGDSGGFQVATGVLKMDWQNFYETPSQPNYIGKVDQLRQRIVNWLEHTADYSMILDVPTFSALPPYSDRTGLKTFQECLDATLFNVDWILRNRQGKTKFLNVLQGGSDAEADIWYEQVKNLPFEGWAMGGNNMQDIKLFLRRMITLRDDKLLEKGERDLVHVLGTGKLDWAVMLTAIKRKLNATVNPDLLLTFDAASPFLCTAFGQMYTQHVHKNDRFSYIMDKAIDDRRLKGSNIPLPWNSPIANRLTLGDICHYGPGDLNKNGKESMTSWDSFGYMLMMAHNVYQHIESVQRANVLADTEFSISDLDLAEWRRPGKGSSKSLEVSNWVPRNLIYFNHLVDAVFDSETPMQVIEDNAGLLAELSKNKTRKSSNTVFSDLFDIDTAESDADDEHVFDELEAQRRLGDAD
jgi:hypothetical protein